MSEFKLYVSGRDAEKAATKISQIFEEIFSTPLAVHRVQQQPQEGGTYRSDIFAIATFIMSIPGTILAVMDILERMKRKTQLEKFLKELKHISQKYPHLNIYLEVSKGTVIEFRKEDVQRLLEQIIRALEKGGEE